MILAFDEQMPCFVTNAILAQIQQRQCTLTKGATKELLVSWAIWKIPKIAPPKIVRKRMCNDCLEGTNILGKLRKQLLLVVVLFSFIIIIIIIIIIILLRH